MWLMFCQVKWEMTKNIKFVKNLGQVKAFDEQIKSNCLLFLCEQDWKLYAQTTLRSGHWEHEKKFLTNQRKKTLFSSRFRLSRRSRKLQADTESSEKKFLAKQRKSCKNEDWRNLSLGLKKHLEIKLKS